MKYLETNINNKRAHVQEFDSISDLRNHINITPVNRVFSGRTRSSEKTNRRGFTGVYDYQEAENLLTGGWQVKAEALAKKVPVQTVSSNVRRSTPSYGVVGYQASVPRYVMGVPQNMINNKPVTVNQKIITINKDIGFLSDITPEQIEAEGIKNLQIIQALENKGYRVKLNIVWLTHTYNETAMMKVCIKKPEERLSLIKVAFPLIHPAMLRLVGFRWLEKLQELTSREFVGGYGVSEGSLYKSLLKKGEYLLPNFIPNVEEYVAKLGL